MTLGEQLLQYWQFIVFVVGGVVAFVMGRERNRWRTDEVGKEVQRAHEEIDKLEDKIDAIRDNANANNTALTSSLIKLQTQMSSMHQLLTEVRDDVRHKADK